MSEREIFTAARDIADPAARAAYLDTACAGDGALRARVEALLRADARPDSLLDVPVVSPPEPGAAPTRAFRARGGDPAGDGPTRTQGEVTADDTDDALGFLAPAGRPDSLGRVGHYEVLEVLGRGAFGVVYRAFDDVLQRVVAVKVLAPSLATTSPARKRFLREARSAAPIQHENVVRVFETGEEPLPYLVMEFVPGETLQDRLDRTGPLEVPEALRIGRQVAEGLAAAHEQGLIHRDIKPSNILIERGPGERAKITDFGLARAADDASLTRSGTVAGTPMYMAPEQARGESLDHRADLFSLGSVLYAMLTGRPPFRAETTLAVLKRVAEDAPRPIREVIPEVPEWLCRIVEKLHAKDPADRYQTARAVADVLADCERQLQAHKEVKDFARIPDRRPAAPAARRSAGVIALLAIGCVPALLALVAVAGVVLYAMLPVRDDGVAVAPTPAPEVTPGPDADGWVQLFNGRDLTGWATGGTAGKWRVVDRVLVGSDGPGFLVSEGRYRDFHFKVEGKLAAPGNGGINFRDHLQAEINDNPKVPTGSLVALGGTKPGATAPYPHPVVPADAWFTLEVRAVGPDVWVRVNEHPWLKKTAEPPEPGGSRFSLEVLPGAEIYFRKIEVKDLSPAAPTPLDRDDLAKLKGEWLVALGKDRAAGEEFAVRLGDGDFEFRFTGGKPLAGTFQVDAANKQLLLKFTGQPAPFRCPYRVAGDSLRLTLTPPGPGDAAPLTADEFLRTRELMHAVNNVKQQAIGILNYSETQQTLPPAARPGKDGKPLLSWRVLILPYIGEEALYKEFDLDEPWDGEHNKKLVGKMPGQFRSPHRKPAGPGLTHFRVFVGPGTAFEPQPNRERGIRLQDVTDGTMTTLLIAEAADPVIWTKPDELPFGPKEKLAALGTPEDGALVARCDGSVMMLAPDPADAALRAFVTRNGGEPVPELALKSTPLPSRPALLECRRRVTLMPAVVPFDAAKAKEHQEAWARHLGVKVEFENTVGMTFRLIPPGEFAMGTPQKDMDALLGEVEEWEKKAFRTEVPPRRVRVAAPAYLGAHEVTVGQFKRFVAETGHRTTAETNGKGGARVGPAGLEWKPEYTWRRADDAPSDDHPVGQISLDDARAFCAWMGGKDGLTYVVPDEELWEFACRAGTETPWFSGLTEGALAKVAWYAPNAKGTTHAVGGKQPNAFGLFDTLGNAEELCVAAGGKPVARGGHAGHKAARVRSATRFEVSPEDLWHRRGFRVAVVGNLKPAVPSAPPPRAKP